MKKYYARSGSDKNIPPQTYYDHISGASERCKTNIDAMLLYCRRGNEYKRLYRAAILLALEYHDLGKLDPENQKILSGQKKFERLPYRHEDAGSALLKKYYKKAGLLPVFLVYSHHHGMPDKNAEKILGEYSYRLFRQNDGGIKEYIDRQLDTYWKIHCDIFHKEIECPEKPLCYDGLSFRLALSCLADADHGDAAYWENNSPEVVPCDRNWQERLSALDRYIDQMNIDSPRNHDRDEVYHACRNLPLGEDKMKSCSSPVGTGKTTAVMAVMLRFAMKYNLRHIFVVLPYTNIIQQTVDIYRKVLVLPDENPEEIIAEHHHLADFSSPGLRSLSTLWKSPIIVTTAVQFFETLGSNNPTSLRKLQELPGSAIFIDEAHATMPLHLWPQVWAWLKNLAENWSCPVILGSGSLRKFWENNQFFKKTESLQDVLPDELRKKLQTTENARVRFRRQNKAWNLNDLKKHVLSDTGGSKLIVLNTIYSAASVARALREDGADVLHLSTALTPNDRAKVLEQIKKRLDPNDPEYRDDWILIATSCVETGIDFSFTKAYRECCSLMNLFQIAGRINRHLELSKAGTVISFRLLKDKKLSLHTGFGSSQNILDQLFDENWFDGTYSNESIMAEEFRRLVEYDSVLESKNELIIAEKTLSFSKVAKLCNVIENNDDSRLVIIDQDIVERLKAHEKVSSLELQRNSVQIPRHNLERFHAEKIFPNDDSLFNDNSPYYWTLQYDPDFLGYMTEETQNLFYDNK